jgi:hypothetical protein
MKNKPLPGAPVTTTANSEDALQFVRRLQEEYFREKPPNEQAFVEQYLDRFPRGELRSIGRRILMDIMKRPQISTAAGPAPAPEEPGRAAPERGRTRRGTGSRRRRPRER